MVIVSSMEKKAAIPLVLTRVQWQLTKVLCFKNKTDVAQYVPETNMPQAKIMERAQKGLERLRMTIE